MQSTRDLPLPCVPLFTRFRPRAGHLRRITFALSITLGFSVLPGQESRGAEAGIKVGVLTDNEPFSFADKEGRIQGFVVDLLEGIERHMALQFDRVTGTTSEINGAFLAGRLDLLQSYARSPAREDHADFSVPYLSMSGSIFTRKGVNGLDSLTTLRGKRILVHRGSLGEQLLRNAGLDDSIVIVDSVEQAFRLLQAGEGDATLAARLTGLATIHRLRLDRVIAAGPPLPGFAVDYCFAVQDGDRALLAQINEGLAILQRTDEYDKIYRAWFGHIDPGQYTAVDIMRAIAIGLALAFLLTVWFLLRQRVLHRRLATQSAALRTSEEFHRGIFDASPDGLAMLASGTDGILQVESANQAFAGLLGLEHPPVSGTRLHDLLPAGSTLEATLAASPSQTPSPASEHLLNLPQGSRWVRASSSRVGHGVLVVLSDITGEKAALDRLLRSERHLRHVQKLEAIGTLASGIAHDFNNILTSIGGNTELSRLRLPPSHPAQENLAEVTQAAGRAAALVRQILMFARRTESRRLRIDVRDAIEETLRFLRSASPSFVEIEHLRPDGPVFIDFDPTQLHQVLMNIGTNAVQALGEKPGSVVYRTEMEAGGGVCITVSDTGPGMTPEVVARIFEPFFTTKPPGCGTGLGLSVVHGIVESHGGTIAVDSTPGRGSIFRLGFPPATLEGAPRREDAAAPRPALPKGHGERILFVDDETAITEVAAELLPRLGYRVSLHNDPAAAWEEFNQRPESFDLVLSDLTMPGMNGVDLLAAIQARRPDLPRLLMSGYLGPEQLARCQKAGLSGVLDKPLSVEGIALALASALGKTGRQGSQG